MFRFEQPYYLFALLLIPFLSVLWWWWSDKMRQKIWLRWGDESAIRNLITQKKVSHKKVKNILILAALSLFSIAAANPQWGTTQKTIQQKSSDIFIALDISQSMMAQDVAPNRLERARNFLQQFLPALRGERVGLVLFAGNAYMQMPLTSDLATTLLFIKSANCDMASSQGTAIAEAIELVKKSFPKENERHKALIIISDGESHDDDAIAKVAEAHEQGLTIFTVGVGTQQGGLVPDYFGGQESYKRDSEGKPILSKLDENALSEIATVGGGSYQNIEKGNEVLTAALKNNLEKIGKYDLNVVSFEESESYFPYFIGLGLLLLGIELLLREDLFRRLPKNKKSLNLSIIFLISSIFVTKNVQAQDSHLELKAGDKSYKSQRYAEAEKNYRAAIESKNSASTKYNLGNSVYQQGRYDESTREYEVAANNSEDKSVKSKAFHNQGNAFFQEKKYDKSSEAYRKALRLQPNDSDSKYNLALSQKLLKEQQQQKSQENKPQEQAENKSEKKENEDENKSEKDEKIKNKSAKNAEQKTSEAQKLSKEEATKMLRIMDEEERKVQQKLRKTAVGKSNKPLKDW